VNFYEWDVSLATKKSISVLMRTTMRILEFLTKFSRCGLGEIVGILWDQLPWRRFAVSERCAYGILFCVSVMPLKNAIPQFCSSVRPSVSLVHCRQLHGYRNSSRSPPVPAKIFQSLPAHNVKLHLMNM